MIKTLKLLHYLSEDTYKNICNVLALDSSVQIGKNNFVSYPDKAIFQIHPFNILYKQFGHIWFLNIFIDFQKFQCGYNDFEQRLFIQYEKSFGKKIMNDFPTFEQIICEYVSFYNILKIKNIDNVIKSVREYGCPSIENELDICNLKNADKPHGKIEFCISKKDNSHIETLAHCFGTALKKRIKDKSLHGPVGIKVSKIVNRQTEEEIVNWLLEKNKLEIHI
jgi:hypothetical protein